MRKLSRLIVVLAALASPACPGCDKNNNPAGPGSPPPSGVTTLTFVGTARLGHQPLAGVSVNAGGFTGVTDAMGQVTLQSKLDPSTNVQATLPGFLPRSTKVRGGHIIMRPIVVNTNFTQQLFAGGVDFPAGDMHAQLPAGADANVWRQVAAQVSAKAHAAGRSASVVIGGSGNDINVVIGGVDPGNGATSHPEGITTGTITGGTINFRDNNLVNVSALIQHELWHFYGLRSISPSGPAGMMNQSSYHNYPTLTQDEFDAFRDTVESLPGTGSPDNDSFLP